MFMNFFSSFGHHDIRRKDRIQGGIQRDVVIEELMVKSIKSAEGLTRGRESTERVQH